MAEVFLSYARDDLTLARSLAKEITVAGHSVWMDDRLNAGQEWQETLRREAQNGLCLVGLWTPSAIDADGLFRRSGWIELEHSWAGTERIAGVIANGGRAPGIYTRLQQADLSKWIPGQWNPEFQKLDDRIRELKSIDGLKRRNQELLDKLRIAEERLSAHSSERGNITAHIHERVTDEARSRAELELKFQKLEREFTDLLCRVVIWKENSQQADVLISSLRATINELEADKKKLSTDILHFKNESEDLANRSRELQSDLERSRREFAEFRRRGPLVPPS